VIDADSPCSTARLFQSARAGSGTHEHPLVHCGHSIPGERRWRTNPVTGQRSCHKVVVAEVGATLRSWRVDEREVLLTHATHLGDSFLGKVLLPWANRIDAATHTFGGVEYQTPASENWSGHAIHGLVAWVPWTLVRHDRDRLVLGYTLYPQYGYPFAIAFQIKYLVSGQGLRVPN
jgi:galactose mutarotase-like enzyme